jgi:hypothetical protein
MVGRRIVFSDRGALCRPFAIIGLGSANSPFDKGLVMAGRLVLRPVD